MQASLNPLSIVHYATHSPTKPRTRQYPIGSVNLTGNAKFIFRITPEFLASKTSTASVAIYSVDLLRSNLIGTIRFLVSNILRSNSDSDGKSIRTLPFSTIQICYFLWNFHGFMNIDAMGLEGSDFSALNRLSAIGYRDRMGEKTHHHGKRHNDQKKLKLKNQDEVFSESCKNSCVGSTDLSDGADSSISSSSYASMVLKDWNAVRELAGSKSIKASGF